MFYFDTKCIPSQPSDCFLLIAYGFAFFGIGSGTKKLGAVGSLQETTNKLVWNALTVNVKHFDG